VITYQTHWVLAFLFASIFFAPGFLEGYSMVYPHEVASRPGEMFEYTLCFKGNPSEKIIGIENLDPNFFWSLWKKGEESGNINFLDNLKLDFDRELEKKYPDLFLNKGFETKVEIRPFIPYVHVDAEFELFKFRIIAVLIFISAVVLLFLLPVLLRNPREAKHWKSFARNIVFFFLLQTISFVFLSDSQIANMALGFTPDNTHFIKGTHFSWVFLKNEDPNKLPNGLFENVASKLLARYKVVYLKEQDIPDSAVFRGGRFLDYKDGFRFSFKKANWHGYFLTIWYEDYEASLAASSHSYSFVWILGFWVKIWDHGGTIS